MNNFELLLFYVFKLLVFRKIFLLLNTFPVLHFLLYLLLLWKGLFFFDLLLLFIVFLFLIWFL